ncbi:outer membrane protein transport protein [Pseudomonas cichorii]|uniref:Outer membrane protein transport protein n=1 Tax=Pseudomonas lijiangensis TaxID=2995658 RepID=A0ABX8HYC6_9PSED|nr:MULTISPECIES: outer membrane protein transport protein [Pseudomonas syringae group]MBX8490546.1 outer membrane protein transport protein [Pseudomonas cichorii]MBX8499050.1 outer membrane protein transport protein [Pseudomonas lijiangensis]MBX8504081.1 outer membrane protein transport protein [Pseudomonas lijiangensis]MBX8545691.1 outer membrane protein transport protein [Pseudomonas cichorii]MBX8550809.1 outer membrane protein transport protein [Pseudomonas cichorii]
MLKTSLGLTAALVSTQLLAGGFARTEQSISGMGIGQAGRASAAEDASTVYGNPAGMARLEGRQITAGVAFIDASTDISHVSGRSSGSNDGDMVPFSSVPFGFYTQQLDEHWAFGFGVYAPFGLSTDYENGFQGRMFASKSDIKVVTLQPTISYAFNDRLSIGFGPTLNRIAGTLESDITLSPAIPDTHVKVKGDDTALGFNVGVLFNATDTTRVGLTYHSKVDYKLDCHTQVATGAGTPPLLLASNRYDCTLKVTTPESYDFSVTQELSDAWTLYASATWTGWSRLQDLSLRNQPISAAQGGSLASALTGSIQEGLNWHDTWAYAIGTAYRLNPQWVLRTGLMFDQSPTSNTNRSPRTPTGDRRIFSLGVGYNVTPQLTLDLAYSYLREESVDVSRANALGSYSATYQSDASLFGVGATYRF